MCGTFHGIAPTTARGGRGDGGERAGTGCGGEGATLNEPGVVVWCSLEHNRSSSRHKTKPNSLRRESTKSQVNDIFGVSDRIVRYDKRKSVVVARFTHGQMGPLGAGGGVGAPAVHFNQAPTLLAPQEYPHCPTTTPPAHLMSHFRHCMHCAHCSRAIGVSPRWRGGWGGVGVVGAAKCVSVVYGPFALVEKCPAPPFCHPFPHSGAFYSTLASTVCLLRARALAQKPAVKVPLGCCGHPAAPDSSVRTSCYLGIHVGVDPSPSDPVVRASDFDMDRLENSCVRFQAWSRMGRPRPTGSSAGRAAVEINRNEWGYRGESIGNAVPTAHVLNPLHFPDDGARFVCTQKESAPTATSPIRL